MELEYPRKNKATKPGSNDGNGERRFGSRSQSISEEQANFSTLYQTLKDSGINSHP